MVARLESREINGWEMDEIEEEKERAETLRWIESSTFYSCARNTRYVKEDVHPAFPAFDRYARHASCIRKTAARLLILSALTHPSS